MVYYKNLVIFRGRPSSVPSIYIPLCEIYCELHMILCFEKKINKTTIKLYSYKNFIQIYIILKYINIIKISLKRQSQIWNTNATLLRYYMN